MPHSKNGETKRPPSFGRLWRLWFNILRDPGRFGPDADSRAYLRELSLSHWQFGLIRGLEALLSMLPLFLIRPHSFGLLAVAILLVIVSHTLITAVIAFIQVSIKRMIYNHSPSA